MNSFELNKIIGAVLGTLLFVMGVGFVAEIIYSPIEDRGPGYALPEPAEEADVVAETEAPAEPPLGVLLVSASAEQGQSAARKCQACHNFGQGEGNKAGPELYDVVGRVVGSHPGFAYSEDMQSRNATGDTWTYEALNTFLAAPKAEMPGTKMNFAGVKRPEERASILAYLATLSPTPLPFPPAEATAAEAPASDAPATGAAETPAVPSSGDAVATPTETRSETPVKGTATTSGTGGTEPMTAAGGTEPSAAAIAEPAAPTTRAEPGTSAIALLASAVPERGQAATRVCQVCHTFGEGEPNKLGPALYGVVGRVMGSQEGFKYSDPMLAHTAAGNVWTYEALDAFLAAPKTFMPGTKMAFAGVKTPEGRADMLAYLATLSPSPAPFPPVGATAAAAPADAPAAAEAPAEPTAPTADTPAAAAAEAPAAPEAPASPVGALLASAVPERGQAAARKCQACHTFGEGEPNKLGPALYGVVGRAMGSQEGFKYSDPMLAHTAAGDVWTYEALDAFIAAPKTFMPGTKMAFAGVKTAEERADILSYLATLSPSPVPFPPAAAGQ